MIGDVVQLRQLEPAALLPAMRSGGRNCRFLINQYWQLRRHLGDRRGASGWVACIAAATTIVILRSNPP